MKMTVHTRLGAALAAAVIIPALALAQGPAPQDPDQGEEMHDMGGGPGMGMHRMGGGHGMGMHHRGGHGMGLAFLVNNPEMRTKLGITDEQAAKIRQQTLDFQKAEIRAHADLQVKRLELHSLLAAETPDRPAIDRALQEVGAAQIALEKNTIDQHLAMRSALTPEQRQRLRQMREEFGHRGAGGGQHGPGGPSGPGGPGGPHHRMRPGAQDAPKPANPPAAQ